MEVEGWDGEGLKKSRLSFAEKQNARTRVNAIVGMAKI